jgi:RimJ/RimL family protein N-acetyltransferase
LVEERAYISVQKKQSLKKEMYWLVEKLKRIDMKLNIILLMEIDKEIKGLAEIERFSQRTIPAAHIGELEIILARDIRGKGFGTRFFSTITREAKKRLKLKIIFVDVAKPNKYALEFYQNLGFKIIGKIKKGFKYYGRYFDDVILVKYLK